jgi:hypothetical protein
MLPTGVMMRPVNDPTLVIPYVLAIEVHQIAFRETGNARGNVDIVGYEQRLPRCEPENETLMARLLQVIIENPDYRPFSLDLNVARVISERRSDAVLAAARRSPTLDRPDTALPGSYAADYDRKCTDKKSLPHAVPPPDESRAREYSQVGRVDNSSSQEAIT